jgi:hypothetical protein
VASSSHTGRDRSAITHGDVGGWTKSSSSSEMTAVEASESAAEDHGPSGGTGTMRRDSAPVWDHRS